MGNKTVKYVVEDSAAYEGGVIPGDTLISVNGKNVKDIFDYKMYTSDVNLLLKFQAADGEIYEVEIEKEMYEDIGLEFENSMLDNDMSCCNKCLFCFVDQMPKGMRDTLYFKDDDPRLSFLTGNYVTLTNINGDELNRLISYRLSPVNVSVHTTNPELRVKMLKNKNAGDIMDKLKKLGEANIELNCQIVLCPGINDGDELVKTVEDLISLGSSVKSLSVVPVGITRFRENLPEIKLYGENEAREIIQYVEATQKKLKKQRGTNFIYAADELYISANMEIPKYSEYEDFPQIENGVGMMALLKHEVKEYINETVKSTRSPMNRKVTIATGVAAYDIIKELACEVEKLFDGLKVQVLSITNTFFGETVTVAGLLTAGDIINQLDGIDLGDELLISKNMLKQDEAVFLDDYTLEDFEKAVGVKVTPVGDSGKEFVEKTGGIKLE